MPLDANRNDNLFQPNCGLRGAVSSCMISATMASKPSSRKTNSKVDEDDLGDHAEGLFDVWCREAGALATSPRKDKVGWDFFVVLPNTGGSLLDAPPRLNCSVQVKAQWSTTKQGPQIKLSNWETMISDPNPWFVFVLVYDRPKQPVRGVLVHVDENWTTKVMRRLWSNAAEKKTNLSDLKMRLNWTDADVLPSLDGPTIIREIRKRIGDPNKYLEGKRRWRMEAGVGPIKYKITLRFRDEDVDYAQLARAAIGDDTSGIEFPSVEVAEVRFGISIPKGLPEASKLSFEPRPLPKKAKIVFTSISPVREEFSIEFDVFSPTSVLPLPDTYRRLRLTSPLLRLEIAPASNEKESYQWKLRIEEKGAPLVHLFPAARAMRVLLDPESPPCTLELFGESLTIDANAPAGMEVSENALAIIDAAINAGAVARSFGVALETLEVRPVSLLRQRETLQVLAGLFSGTTADALLKITTTEQELNGKQVGHVTVQGVRIGAQVLTVSIGLVGIATWTATDDGGMLTIVPTIRILERKTFPACTFESEKFHEQLIQPMIDRAEAVLDREGIHLIRVNWQER